jgi:hypothetical protein
LQRDTAFKALTSLVVVPPSRKCSLASYAVFVY